MKRLLCSLLILLSVVSCFSSCVNNVNESQDDKLNVLTTIFPPYDFAKEVGGDLIEVNMLMAPETDSHSYSGDNPSDILKISNCDLFIYIGGESEEVWVEKVLGAIERSGAALPETLNLSSYCVLIEESDGGILQGEKHTHDHDEDAHHECTFDEHIWTSLSNAEIMVNIIAEKLSEMDGENSEVYNENAVFYTKKLKALDNGFSELFDKCENKTLVFADRFPFAYFASDYSLAHRAAFSGCATETEVSPTTLSHLTKLMKENGIKDVFYIETSKSDVPDLLCRTLDAEKHLLHSCHTVTEKQMKDGVTYLSLMEGNLNTLRKALSND